MLTNAATSFVCGQQACLLLFCSPWSEESAYAATSRHQPLKENHET
jgi:hypothetical protein